MKNRKRVILVSAELKTLPSQTNEARTKSLENALKTKGYNFSQVLGSYKGSLEKSFLIDASEDILKNVHSLAGYFGQESILVVDELQKATLIDSNGQKEVIGEMKQVNSLTGLEGWTLVNGLFFTVK